MRFLNVTLDAFLLVVLVVLTIAAIGIMVFFGVYLVGWGLR